jgi:hypothetical protein
MDNNFKIKCDHPFVAGLACYPSKFNTTVITNNKICVQFGDVALLHRRLDTDKKKTVINPTDGINTLSVGMYLPVFIDALEGMLNALEIYVNNTDYELSDKLKTKLINILNKGEIL